MRYRQLLTGTVAGGAVLLAALTQGSGQTPHGGTTARAPEGCEDSQGGAYAPGFVVTIGGKLMKCVVGPHWVPVDPTPASLSEDVLDVGDANLNAEQEADILAALSVTGPPLLDCDTVLNSSSAAEELTRVPAGERRLMVFWTPTCGPCKPLLVDLAALAASKPANLSVVGVVRSAVPDLEPPGDWRLERVKRLVAEHHVQFPTCVHSSNTVTKEWHAEGVPIIFLLSNRGVERVVAGGNNGQRFVAELSASVKGASR